MPANSKFLRPVDEIGITTADFTWSDAEKDKWRTQIANNIVGPNKQLKNQGLRQLIFAIGRDHNGNGVAVGITLWKDKKKFQEVEKEGSPYADQRDKAIQALGGTGARTLYLEVIAEA